MALMLADRAPGVLDRLFGDRAQRLWARIDASERAEVLTSAGPPEPDTAVHVAIWFGLTLAVALTLWTWRGLVVAGIGAAGFGVAVEWAQQRWSTGRSAEWSDVAADLVGTALGLMAAAIVITGWSALAAVFDRVAARGSRTERHDLPGNRLDDRPV